MPHEIEHTYECRGGAAELMDCTAPEILFEGPAGTGKTRAVLHKIADLCEAYPGARALICRATRVSCTESILVTLERDVLHGYPWLLGDASRAHRDSYQCINGSSIVVGGLDKPEKLYSTEWDLVYVAEAIEIDEDSWEKFARAMRNRAIPKGVSGGPLQAGEAQAVETDAESGITAPAFWTQRIADCNPAAPGHWLNQRPLKNPRMARIKSRHADNPSITPGELAELRALTGHRRARLYEGRWVAAEGCVFAAEFTEKNRCRSFGIDDWPVVIGYDPGYRHPCAVEFYCIAPDRQPFVIDEIYGPGKTLADVAEAITDRISRGRYNVVDWLIDPAGDQHKQDASGRSIREQMHHDHGLKFRPWPKAQGVAKTAQVEALRSLLIAEKPLMIFEDKCPNLINELQSWEYKKMADGSLPAGDDAYVDLFNDAIDAICGIVATRPAVEKPTAGLMKRAS